MCILNSIKTSFLFIGMTFYWTGPLGLSSKLAFNVCKLDLVSIKAGDLSAALKTCRQSSRSIWTNGF